MFGGMYILSYKYGGVVCTMYIVCTKVLSKQEGPKVCLDALFLNSFLKFESAACC